MQLVERHVIKPRHPHYQEIDNLCLLSKNLYNYANYLVRQSFIHENTYLNYLTIQKQLQDTEVYQALPSKVSQQVLMGLDKNWQSFFAAMAEWRENPKKFLGRPKLPKYKDKEKGRNLLTYTSQAISKKALKKGVIKLSKSSIAAKTNISDVKQVRVIPKLDHYVIEVVYEVEASNQQKDPYRIASIDIGLDNLAAVTFNQAGIKPLLINGKPLKSINQYFNKRKAQMQSKLGKFSSKRLKKLCSKRNFKVDDYLHKASRLIVNILDTNQIGILIIGKNDNWKQEINIGRQNNKNFVQVPHARFIQMLKYKAELLGICVMEQEESYTSQASFLDLDAIPVHSPENKIKHKFSGTRVKRGLYKSRSGKRFNADINGSYNIMRKAIPTAFSNGIEGAVVHPVRLIPAK
jgi:putative transposase